MPIIAHHLLPRSTSVHDRFISSPSGKIYMLFRCGVFSGLEHPGFSLRRSYRGFPGRGCRWGPHWSAGGCQMRDPPRESSCALPPRTHPGSITLPAAWHAGVGPAAMNSVQVVSVPGLDPTPVLKPVYMQPAHVAARVGTTHTGTKNVPLELWSHLKWLLLTFF